MTPSLPPALVPVVARRLVRRRRANLVWRPGWPWLPFWLAVAALAGDLGLPGR